MVSFECPGVRNPLVSSSLRFTEGAAFLWFPNGVRRRVAPPAVFSPTPSISERFRDKINSNAVLTSRRLQLIELLLFCFELKT